MSIRRAGSLLKKVYIDDPGALISRQLHRRPTRPYLCRPRRRMSAVQACHSLSATAKVMSENKRLLGDPLYTLCFTLLSSLDYLFSNTILCNGQTALGHVHQKVREPIILRERSTKYRFLWSSDCMRARRIQALVPDHCDQIRMYSAHSTGVLKDVHVRGQSKTRQLVVEPVGSFKDRGFICPSKTCAPALISIRHDSLPDKRDADACAERLQR